MSWTYARRSRMRERPRAETCCWNQLQCSWSIYISKVAVCSSPLCVTSRTIRRQLHSDNFIRLFAECYRPPSSGDRRKTVLLSSIKRCIVLRRRRAWRVNSTEGASEKWIPHTPYRRNVIVVSGSSRVRLQSTRLFSLLPLPPPPKAAHLNTEYSPCTLQDCFYDTAAKKLTITLLIIIDWSSFILHIRNVHT